MRGITAPRKYASGATSARSAVFRKVNFLIHNLRGKVDGVEYQLKLAAPWTGFKYLLRRGELELASAKKSRRMHAFEPQRPLIRHTLIEFDLDVGGRPLRLTPEDRHGHTYRLLEGETACGALAMRTFDAQTGGAWQADLEMPSDWSAPHAAFLAWLAREGRRFMGQ